MLQQAMTEVCEVAKAHHIVLPRGVSDKAMQFLRSLPPESTASMQRDVIEGRPSELEAQNGAVVRLGREVGVGTPIHSFLYGSLLPMEMEARGLVELRRN
jgi:2-dehydropantoate 2-reductase